MNLFVSGIQTIKQFQQLDGMNVMYGGLIFSPSVHGSLSGEADPSLFRNTDWDTKKVGVFADAETEEILQKMEDYGLDLVLLNGNETPAFCEKISAEIETIKTFRIEDQSLQPIDYQIKEYDEYCDYYLFENVNAVGIPNPQSLNYLSRLAKSRIEKPFFIGGDIHPNDAERIRDFRHPDFYGVMIDRLFEKEPGVKDMLLVLQFQRMLKTA